MCLAVDVFVVGTTASLWLAGGGYMTHCMHVVFMQGAHLFPFAWKGKFVVHKLQGQFASVLHTLHSLPCPVRSIV